MPNDLAQRSLPSSSICSPARSSRAFCFAGAPMSLHEQSPPSTCGSRILTIHGPRPGDPSSANGHIRINKVAISVTHAIIHQHVGLEEIGHGIWDIYYGPIRLGQLNERKRYIEDALGRRTRNKRIH